MVRLDPIPAKPNATIAFQLVKWLKSYDVYIYLHFTYTHTLILTDVPTNIIAKEHSRKRFEGPQKKSSENVISENPGEIGNILQLKECQEVEK